MQQPLDGSVLALLAVKREEARVEPVPREGLGEGAVDGIQYDSIIPASLERSGDAMAGSKRHIALRRAPSRQDGDADPIGHGASAR